MAIELSTLEESVAPDGWICQWDKYVICNLLRLWTNKIFHKKKIKKSCLFNFIIYLEGGILFLWVFKQILDECRVLLTFISANYFV